MLTKGDDFPLHQTSEPIAYSGTDRNFYDRYWFNGYSPDGSVFFAVAFGVYPHVNIADAHFSVVLDGVQHNLHASRVLNMERFDIEVGPIRIVVEEPLQRLRVVVTKGEGITADLLFEGRSFPIEEPRFIHRVGPRSLMDYTRMTQNGRWTGWVEVDGKRQDLPAGTVGTRDRSWGVRPIGTGDMQPYAPARAPGFFWQWCPLNFADKSVFYQINADADGRPFNLRSVIAPDGAGPDDMLHTSEARMDVTLTPGTRHAAKGVLTLNYRGRPEMRLTFEPFLRFQMAGIGYFNPEWIHGGYRGELKVARDAYRLAELDINDPMFFHIQALSRVTLETDGAAPEHGVGAFEQLILGPYHPLGLGDSADPAGFLAAKSAEDPAPAANAGSKKA